ncbi:MAG: ribosome small subunit-dependent GTPase A [Alistipes sp.]|nr:ribosome small subunit-dependent GTPase A [Alistipes sp.]
MSDMLQKGVVICATGSWYDVLSEGGSVCKCRIRGRMRLKGVRSTSPVVVGDEVLFTEDGEDFVIEELSPRRNYIIRRASNLSKESHIIASNIDRAMLVVTLSSPRTAPEFVDRFLITCEAYSIPATILLAKIDLTADRREEVEAFRATYESAGYEVVEISALHGTGLDRVRELVAGRTTLVAGNSGVGKSTLIGALEPTLDVRTGEISQSHHKGRHTTTFSTMYPLTGGGSIIDTPGVKGFGLIDIEDAELCRYFPDMMRYAPECRYYNCTHVHEPDCAVVRAVEKGEIAYSRYESYLKILDEDEKYRK